MRSRAQVSAKPASAVAHGIEDLVRGGCASRGDDFIAAAENGDARASAYPKIGAPGRRGERDRRAVQNPPGFNSVAPAPKSTPARRT